MKTYHAPSMHQLLSPELLQSQESISQVCDRPCPFCQREFERPNDLQQHVAGHLESTALLSLPNLDSIEEGSEAGQVNSNSANRTYAESRADDFDRMVPLVFPENDHSGDIPRMTEMSKELFRHLLEVESVPFNYLNEVNVEARQAYSSGLAGEWLSHLPIELGEEGEEGEVPSEFHSESFSILNFTSKIVGLQELLSQVYSAVNAVCDTRSFPDLSTKLHSLQVELRRLAEATASAQNLSDWQESKVSAIRCDCADILTYIDKTTVIHRTPNMRSRRTRAKLLQTEVDLIRSRLTSISSQSSVLIASYVISARTFYKGLTICSFPRQVKEGAVESGEGLEISGQSVCGIY